VYVQGRRTESAARAVLRQVDRDISQGYLGRAGEALSRLGRLPRDEELLLGLLKRAYLLGRSSGDSSLFASLSRRASAADHRSGRLRLAAAYGMLRSGEPKAALSLLRKGAAPPEAAAGLAGEAALRTGSVFSAETGPAAGLAALQGSRDAARFEEVARQTGAASLLLDAALLRMSEGNPDVAVRLSSELPAGYPFDEPAGFISYDASDNASTRLRLSRLASSPAPSPEVLLVFGDCLLLSGRPAEARRAYGEALSREPAASWVPYLNLARIAESGGDAAGADAYRARARELFPDQEEVFLDSARAAASSGSGEEAGRILSGLLARRPGSLPANLMALSLEAPRLSPEAYRGRVWKLFDASPSDPAAAGVLIEALTAVRDWKGVEEAADAFEAAGGERGDARIALYRSAAAALQGKLAEAEARLRRVSGPARAEARYDLALVLLAGGRAAEARAVLAEAAAALPAGGAGAPNSVLSLVETRTAQADLLSGDASGAGRALARALNLDPDNRLARLLARKLEAGKDQ
jgi:predicted negative regulator of RcsB-dependent stress response